MTATEINTHKLAGLPVPIDAMLQHVAVLGKTGSGKTYAAKLIVEALLRLKRRVCVLDPTGAWWGLRSSADGTEPGFPVPIFGGDHADIAINEHAGAALGELVGKGSTPAVIDLSNTTLGERHRFVERFAESLYRVNRHPLHLVIDEADEFAPQSPGPDAARMLGAIDRIVRRGRIKGFRVMMITQRPAVLNKNVLTQANTLIAMRLPASQDRKAIELWVKGQADEGQAAELLGSLASLQRGEGWVWAPEQGTLQRVKFPKISTFDSGRTPDEREYTDEEAPDMAGLDLTEVRAAMASAIEEAKANDPAELRKRIAELERAAKARPAAAPSTGEDSLRKRLSILDEHCKHLEAANAEHERWRRSAVAVLKNLSELASQDYARLVFNGPAPGCAVEAPPPPNPLNGRQRGIDTPREGGNNGGCALPLDRKDGGGVNGHAHRAAKVPDGTAAKHESRGAGQSGPAPEGSLPAPLQKIVDAIVWWAEAGVSNPSRAQVAAVAGYTPTGGTFARYLSSLSSSGHIAYPSPGAVTVTMLGADVARDLEHPPTLESLHERAMAILEAPHRKIMKVLLDAGGNELGRTQLGELAGYEASGGTFARYVSHLSSIGFIRYPRRTTIAPAAWLFPEGLT